MKLPPNFTLRLRSQLATTAAQARPLAKPAGVLVLPPELSGFQPFVDKVHHRAGKRTA